MQLLQSMDSLRIVDDVVFRSLGVLVGVGHSKHTSNASTHNKSWSMALPHVTLSGYALGTAVRPRRGRWKFGMRCLFSFVIRRLFSFSSKGSCSRWHGVRLDGSVLSRVLHNVRSELRESKEFM